MGNLSESLSLPRGWLGSGNIILSPDLTFSGNEFVGFIKYQNIKKYHKKLAFLKFPVFTKVLVKSIVVTRFAKIIVEPHVGSPFLVARAPLECKENEIRSKKVMKNGEIGASAASLKVVASTMIEQCVICSTLKGAKNGASKKTGSGVVAF